MMPYIDRDQAGNIIGIYATEQRVGQELVDGEPSLYVPPKSATEQIEELERDTLLPRPVRDFMLISMEIEAAKQGITPAQLRLVNPGYRKVKELDEQIAALRAML